MPLLLLSSFYIYFDTRSRVHTCFVDKQMTKTMIFAFALKISFDFFCSFWVSSSSNRHKCLYLSLSRAFSIGFRIFYTHTCKVRSTPRISVNNTASLPFINCLFRPSPTNSMKNIYIWHLQVHIYSEPKKAYGKRALTGVTVNQYDNKFIKNYDYYDCSISVNYIFGTL